MNTCAAPHPGRTAADTRTDTGRETDTVADTPNPIQIQKFLGGVDYPASREALLSKAKDSGADSNVIRALEAIPDKQYDSPTAVSSAVSDNSTLLRPPGPLICIPKRERALKDGWLTWRKVLSLGAVRAAGPGETKAGSGRRAPPSYSLCDSRRANPYVTRTFVGARGMWGSLPNMRLGIELAQREPNRRAVPRAGHTRLN
jgi:hypothetical protein